MTIEPQIMDIKRDPDVTPQTKAKDQQPKKMTENLFKQDKRSFFGRLLGKKEIEETIVPEPETIEPILLLMKENGYTDTVHNVKTGEFIIQTPKGEKSIWLTPDKLTTIKMGDLYYKGWIAYENCMTPYPEDPIFSAELQRRINQRIAINYRDLNEAAILTARTKMWIFIIGAIVLGLVMLFSTDMGQNLVSQITGGGGQAVAGAAQAATGTQGALG